MKQDAIDMLLDPENDEPIVFLDSAGNEIEFEQEAVMDYRGKMYALLTPTARLDGLCEGESLIFEIVKKKNESCLRAVTDKKVIGAVYSEYLSLCESEEAAKDGEASD